MTPVERQPRITVTIDEQPYLGRDGQTVLDIARENGVPIPTLCYTPLLKPLGACRMCVVEVAGTPTPVTACTSKAVDGMVVQTRTATLERLRRETLKMILLRHPLNCSACEINGSCELQDLVHQYDISHQDLHTYNVPPVEFAAAPWATPLIQYHPSRCILCGRCVEACLELGEVGAINFKGRGASATIAPVQPTEAFKPECISCGECMAICPANALTEAMGKPKGKPWETRRVKTVCSYCGCGCELELNVVKNEVVGVTPSRGGVNKGALCVKGRFGYHFVNHKDRLKSPMIKRDGYWQEANWDEALSFAAERLAHIRNEHGPDALAGLTSARCTNEDNYVFQKMFRGVLGTNNIDHCARL
jgi:predicted molibdopterin-dependent oxidoreductase YjgC